MAATAPILLGLSGATFLMTAEVGGIIQSFTANSGSKWLDVYDASVGYTTGHVAHDFVNDYSVEVIATGSNGICAASTGVALTLANNFAASNTALIYTISAGRTHNPENLLRKSVTAKQWLNA
jgi:hypothetical protein